MALDPGSSEAVLQLTHMEKFAQRYHITYPVLRDVTGNFVRSFGTTGVPETFVINRKGQIQALQRFPVTTQWLNATLPRIWAEKS